MITREVVGDIIQLAEEPVYDGIVHGCNCLCSMDTGLAPQMKARWPELYEADVEYDSLYKGPDKLGHMSYIIDGEDRDDPFFAINVYTQLDNLRRERDVSYDAIHNAFVRVNEFFGEMIHRKEHYSRPWVLCPQLGAGLGGGDWQIIRAIIDHCTPDVDITIVHHGERK